MKLQCFLLTGYNSDYNAIVVLWVFVCSFSISLSALNCQVTIALEPSDSVISLKRQLASALGHASETQKLFYAPSDGPRRQLQNGRPLSFYLGATATTQAKLQLVVSSTSRAPSPRADQSNGTNSSNGNSSQWSNSDSRERQPSSSGELESSTSALPGFDNNNNSPPRSRSDSSLPVNNGTSNGTSRPASSGRRAVASKRVTTGGGAPAEPIDDQSVCSSARFSAEEDFNSSHDSSRSSSSELDDVYDIYEDDDDISSHSSDYDSSGWMQPSSQNSWWAHNHALVVSESEVLVAPSAAVLRRRSLLGDGDDSMDMTGMIAAHATNHSSLPFSLLPQETRKGGHSQKKYRHVSGASTHQSARWLRKVGANVSFTPSDNELSDGDFFSVSREATVGIDPILGIMPPTNASGRSRKASRKKKLKKASVSLDNDRGHFAVIGGAPSGPQNDGTDDSGRSSEGDDNYDDDDDTLSYSSQSDVSQSVSVIDAQRERALKHATPVSKMSADPMLVAKTKRVHDIVDSLRPDQLQVMQYCTT